MVLEAYTYVFAIGSCFALLEAYNNGANDVANAWATSVSSRSVTYRGAMVLCCIFELLGALTVGARTASTIKNGIIPMDKVEWGWNGGQGLGAIFAGLGMAPAIAGCFAAIIFSLVKWVVHVRKNPVPWAVWTSPFFFLIAGTICTLSIVYKGSPRLGLTEKPAWYIAAVTLGVGFGLFVLSAIFFVPFVHAVVIKKDYTLRWWDAVQGPLLFKRPAPPDAENARVPNYAVVQHGAEDDDVSVSQESEDPSPKKISDDEITPAAAPSSEVNEKQHLNLSESTQEDYQKMLKKAEDKHHANLRKGKGPLGWAMRTLHANPIGAGSIHETHNLIAVVKRIPAQIVVALLYGAHYDIHTAQMGIEATPEGRRMARVYEHAPKYANEVEYLYSFVQIITACTASFAHGANDVGNAVGVWAGMYAAWHSGKPAEKKAEVPLWQIGIVAATICIGFITYGYNIMKVMGNKITYHSPSRGSSMEMGAAITVLVFSQYKLPVSTSMCITGATVGVGLCNGSLKAVNWKRVFLLVFSWIMTIPIAGLIGGCLMGLALNAPHF
ncbi:hypothetical protein RAB80_009250 [Fusarium oxysporum f. sp. vasinfectum]|nr:hypothetical protein RAB80_009250 [Fusarium oxysporum f. sp. vasinfectum]KAK2930701.1 hypothetical protein FoTM2_008211 [Fusarium oxysporum f. sp. vasinfectum]